RAHLYKSPAEGLRVTKLTPRPPMRGKTRGVPTASLMRTRLSLAHERTLRDAQRSGALGPRTPGDRNPRNTNAARGDTPRPRAPIVNGPRPSRTPSPSGVDRMWPRPPRGDTSSVPGSVGGAAVRPT